MLKEKPKKKLTHLQKIKLIESTIENVIRPQLQRDGGDIDLIDVVDNTVYVAFRGQCVDCPASGVTMERFIGTKLAEFVGEDITVKEAE